MKILKKTMILALILITVIFSLVPPKIVKAATESQIRVGNAIANTANDLFNRFVTETIYDYGIGYEHPITGEYVHDSWGRQMAYQNKKTTGMAYRNWGNGYKELGNYENKYAIDCVGFVSMVIRRATGLGQSYFTIFGRPTNGGTRSGVGTGGVGSFVELTGVEPMAGDILCWSGHVAIAIGNGYMIDSGNAGPNGAISRRPISNYSGTYTIVRINDVTAQKLISNGMLNDTWYETALYVESPSAGAQDGGAGSSGVQDGSLKYIVYNQPFGDAEKFYYNGMPITGGYLGEDKSNWVIDGLSNIADWLVGIMTLGYKIQIIGWTTIIQNAASQVVQEITEIDQSVTVEKVLFNDIQILDINFFNLTTAGDGEIAEGHIVYSLRQNISSVYVVIRSVSIIALLVILLYVGIRMAISSTAGDKAKYKKMFMGWVVGFIVVMFIHYFMVVVINLNEQIIEFVKPETETVIYDEARSYAYEIPASKGWMGTILYVFLVYYMIKLLLFYFKRLLVVYILAIIAPITGLAYSLEMIKGKSKTLSVWMKEFAFNVLIQAIHIIIYSVFMRIIYEGFMQNANMLNLLPYAFVMIAVLNLMLRSEKMIKRIFGLKSNTIKDVMDTVVQASGTLMSAVAIATPVYKLAKGQVIKQYDKSIDDRVDYKYKHLQNSEEDIKNSKLATDIQREIDRLKDKEKEKLKQYDRNAINLTKNVMGGLAGFVKAVPVTYEVGAVPGILAGLNAASSLNTPLGQLRTNKMSERRIDELLQKYGMQPLTSATTTTTTQTSSNAKPTNNADSTHGGNNPNSANTANSKNAGHSGNAEAVNKNGKATSQKTKQNTTQNATQAENNNNQTGETEKREVRKYNKKKNKRFKPVQRILSSATAGTSRRVANITRAMREEKQKLGDPYETARIELLYQLQAKVIEEDKKLTGSIEQLRQKGFPPVFYSPGPNEDSRTAAMNSALRAQYAQQLELNLRQAIEVNPSVKEADVAEHLATHEFSNANGSIDLRELQRVLDEIAEEKNYDVGRDFENNIRNTLAKNLIDIVEEKDTKINRDDVRVEILDKVEEALKKHDWDEKATESEIRNIVTKDVAEQIMQKLPANELISIITSAINAKGSLTNKPVAPEFEGIVNSAAKIADMNKDITELAGEEEKYDAEELIEEILNKDLVD